MRQTSSAFDLLHSLHKWVPTTLSCGKYSTTVSTGTVSRLRLCRRSWRFKIDLRWNIVHNWKPHMCSNKLDVQEADVCVPKFNGIWDYFSGCWFANGRNSRAWSLGFGHWCVSFKLKRKTEIQANTEQTVVQLKRVNSECNTQDFLELSHVDSVCSNVNSSLEGALHVFEDNEAEIKMIIKSRRRTLRHVSRTQRAALDWFFDRINVDSKIQIWYVGSKNQLADILTKGHFTRDEWNHLLCFFNISLFSSQRCSEASCQNRSETMAKRPQEGDYDEKVVAKLKPARNLVSRSRAGLSTVPSSKVSSSSGNFGPKDHEMRLEAHTVQSVVQNLLKEPRQEWDDDEFMTNFQVRHLDARSMVSTGSLVAWDSNQKKSQASSGQPAMKNWSLTSIWRGKKNAIFLFATSISFRKKSEWVMASNIKSSPSGWDGRNWQTFSNLEDVHEFINARSYLSWKRLLRESAFCPKYRPETNCAEVVRCDSTINLLTKVGDLGSVRMELGKFYMGEAVPGGRRRGDQTHEGKSVCQTLYCALERCANSPESNAEWERRISWFKDTNECRELDGIDGEPAKFEWMTLPGHTTLQVLHEIQNLCQPWDAGKKNSKDEWSSCRCFNDMEWRNEDNQRSILGKFTNCELVRQKVRQRSLVIPRAWFRNDMVQYTQGEIWRTMGRRSRTYAA